VLNYELDDEKRAELIIHHVLLVYLSSVLVTSPRKVCNEAVSIPKQETDMNTITLPEDDRGSVLHDRIKREIETKNLINISNHLNLLPPDLLPWNNLEQQRSSEPLKLVSLIKKAQQLPSRQEAIDALQYILESNFSCPEELAPRQQSTVKTLKLEEVQDYDRFFRIQRIVSPSPMESFIRSVLISQIVNWNNASERHEAALKLGFQEQIALLERVLASPEETV
jgi:hypothetical protein